MKTWIASINSSQMVRADLCGFFKGVVERHQEHQERPGPDSPQSRRFWRACKKGAAGVVKHQERLHEGSYGI